MEEFPSGQRGQTVNLLSFDFGGPNPPSSTKRKHCIVSRCGVFSFVVKKGEMRTATIARRQIKQSGGLFYRSADPKIHPPPPEKKRNFDTKLRFFFYSKPLK